MHEIAGAALYAMNRFGPAAVEARSAVRCYQEHPQTTPAELGGALLLDARMQTMVGEPDRASAAARRALNVLEPLGAGDRKSTRLNSSHANISYAVFCL